MDAQAKATELTTTILAAASTPQIAAACSGVEAFLQNHTPDQCRWFFSITFPSLICKTFGFDESSSPAKSQSPNGWVDIAMLSGDSELAGFGGFGGFCNVVVLSAFLGIFPNVFNLILGFMTYLQLSYPSFCLTFLDICGCYVHVEIKSYFCNSISNLKC